MIIHKEQDECGIKIVICIDKLNGTSNIKIEHQNND